jgi:hypothetical protein
VEYESSEEVYEEVYEEEEIFTEEFVEEDEEQEDQIRPSGRLADAYTYKQGGDSQNTQDVVIPRFDTQTGEPISPDAPRFDRQTGKPLSSAPKHLDFAPPTGSAQSAPVTLNRKAFRTFVPQEELPVEGFTVLSRNAFSLKSRGDIIDDTLGGISRRRSVSDKLPDWDPLPPVKQTVKRGTAAVGASKTKTSASKATKKKR